MKEKHLTSDWSSFVARVCQYWDTGLSDIQVTEQHAHQRVTWEGTVERIIAIENGMLVGLDMAEIRFELKDGRKGFASRVVLKLAPEHVRAWDDVREGDRVLFTTMIDTPSDDPFTNSGIQWMDLGNNKGYISLSTRESRLMDVMQYGPGDRSKPRTTPVLKAADPLTRLGNYAACWDGSEPGWNLRAYPVMLGEISVDFDVFGPTDEQIEFLRSIWDTFKRCSDEEIREIIGDQSRYTVPAREYSQAELEQIVEEMERLGLGGEGEVDDGWSRLVPVSPQGIELDVDSNELRRHIVERMLDAGAPIEGGKKPVEWWFMDDYVRLQ
jgi:hypothetical protein